MKFRSWKFFLLVLVQLASNERFHCQIATTMNWCFGTGVGVSFTSTPPTIFYPTGSSAPQGPSTISDNNGNLLLYSNAESVWNKFHSVIANGTSLNGVNPSIAYSKSVIVKQPGNANIYYIFTTYAPPTWPTISSSANYAIVDVSLASGNGSVTAKNLTLTVPSSQKLAATRHCNGIDYWVMTHDINSNVFRSYLLTSTGVVGPTLSAVGFSVNFTVNSVSGAGFGEMKFSANGRKLALCEENDDVLGLFDFDNSTGVVSNPLVFNLNSAYGCEFSGDCSKLYASGLGQHMIHQWNICAGSNSAIANSVYSFSTSTSSPFVSITGMQLAPDGRIYISKGLTNELAVLNTPNLTGSSCGYSIQGLSLSPGTGHISLPNIMASDLLQRPTPPPFSFSQSPQVSCAAISFSTPQTSSLIGCPASGFTLVSHLWNFGDPASGSNNTASALNPLHVYSGPGTYTPMLILYYTCGGGTDTLRQVININSPTVNIQTNSVTCAMLGTGTVVAGNTTGPYTYTWLPIGSTGPTVSNLVPGSHTVTVFDGGLGCNTQFTLNLTPLVPLTGLLVNSPSLACSGTSVGIGYYSNLAGGSATQNYTWTNGSVTYNTPSVSALSAGLWSVSIRDALTGCPINDVFLILQPTALTLQVSAATPSACAGNTISLSSQASGGTSGYSYQWANGPPASTNAVSRSSAGTFVYSVTAIDANTCSVTNTVAVDFIANPVLTITHASICPLETGTISVSGASTYTWSNSANTSSISDNPIATTVYTITGEAQTCTTVATATITLKPLPNALISSTSPKCEQTPLNLYSNGGASYLWSGPQAYSSNVQNPLISLVQLSQAGVYNVTVTGANSCTAAAAVTVAVNSIPTVAATGATVCTTQTLNLAANSVAGASFSWNGPNGFTSPLQSPLLYNPALAATGIYTVKATSAAGCTNVAVANALVVTPPSLITTLSSPSLCAQALNGSANSIMLNATGGNTYTLFTPQHITSNANPPWSLSSSPPFTPQIIVSTATLFGSNGVCSTSVTASFSVIPNPTVSILSPTPVICAGQTFTYTSDGAASYTWNASTPNYTSYSNGGVAVGNPSINSVFSVFGSSLGCNSALVTTSISVFPLPEVSVTPQSTNVCIGSSAILQAFGAATSYSWVQVTSGSAGGQNVGTGGTLAAQPKGFAQYIVTGSANSCTRSAVANVSVLPLPVPLANVSEKQVCVDGKVVFTGSGGRYYNWAGPNSIAFAGKTATISASSQLYSGEYTLTVTDENGCANTAKTGFDVIQPPLVGIVASKVNGCAPLCSDFELLTNSIDVSASWNLGDGSFAAKKFNHCFKTPGNYTISGRYTDEKSGCVSTSSLVLNVSSVPVAEFSWQPERPVEGIDEVLFINSTNDLPDSHQNQWHWYFANDKTYQPKKENTTYFFQEAGLYPVALVVTNSAGCADTVVKTIKIEGDFACYIPDAFTPNADSKNEGFSPSVRGVINYELSIFNRWGQLVFHTGDPGDSWDGYFKGEPCKEDVYVYKIVLTTVHGEHKEYSGRVTLYR